MARVKKYGERQLKNVPMSTGRFQLLDQFDKRIWKMQHDWNNPPKNNVAQIVADDGTTSTLPLDSFVLVTAQ